MANGHLGLLKFICEGANEYRQFVSKVKKEEIKRPGNKEIIYAKNNKQ